MRVGVPCNRLADFWGLNGNTTTMRMRTTALLTHRNKAEHEELPGLKATLVTMGTHPGLHTTVTIPTNWARLNARGLWVCIPQTPRTHKLGMAECQTPYPRIEHDCGLWVCIPPRQLRTHELGTTERSWSVGMHTPDTSVPTNARYPDAPEGATEETGEVDAGYTRVRQHLHDVVRQDLQGTEHMGYPTWKQT